MATRFDNNTVILQNANNPLPPSSSQEIKLYNDNGTLKLLKFDGSSTPIIKERVVETLKETIIKIDELVLKELEERLLAAIKNGEDNAIKESVRSLETFISETRLAFGTFDSELRAMEGWASELPKEIDKRLEGLKSSLTLDTRSSIDSLYAKLDRMKNKIEESRIAWSESSKTLKAEIDIKSESLRVRQNTIEEKLEDTKKELNGTIDTIVSDTLTIIKNLEKQRVDLSPYALKKDIKEYDDSALKEELKAYIDERIDALKKTIPQRVGGGVGKSTVQRMIDEAVAGIVPGSSGGDSDVSQTMTYVDGRIATLTSALGTKTFNYDGNGVLTSIIGTGSYPTKTFSYDGQGNLVGIVVS